MGKGKRGSKSKNRTLFLCVLIAIAAIIIIGGIQYVTSLGDPLDSENTATVAVEIPVGSGTGAIGQILEENNVISGASKFKMLSKLEGNDGKYKAGQYNVSPSMDMKQIMEIIITGDSNTGKFTIQEGLTVKQTADKLSEKSLINKDAFMKEVQSGVFDYGFMSLLPDSENRLEGFLYPETYEIYTNATEHQVIDKMLTQFNKLVTDEFYQKAEEMGYNMYQIVTIASLIERETLVADERPTVASVIYNRLAINMPLQIDATVQYALPEHKDRLDYNDLQVDSPYNTYQHTGLPPGPICSPSIDSIKAALNPAATDYYYYVLSPDKNGSHRFSNTYTEFQKNKKAYLNSL